MESKGKIILFSTLLLGLFLMGAYLVYAANTLDTELTAANNTEENRGGAVNALVKNITSKDKWSQGIGIFAADNRSVVMNITLNHTGVTQNISSINITFPTALYSYPSNINFSLNRLIANGNLTGNGSAYNWSIYNTTNMVVALINISLGSAMFNDTAVRPFLHVKFNLTANTGIEDVGTVNVSTYDNQSGVSSVAFTFGVDGSAPRLFVNTTNVSYGAVTRSSGFSAGTYVKNNTGFNITITVTDYNIWKVILVYRNDTATNFLNLNSTLLGDGASLASLTGAGAIPPSVGGANLTGMSYAVMSNLSTLTNAGGTGATAPSYVFRTPIGAGNLTKGGQPFDFVFIAIDLYNQSIQLNNSNNVFRVVNDAYNPGVTVTEPSSTTVATSSSTGIKYTCAGSDVANETIASYDWTLTKPGGSTVAKTTSSATFSTTDIDLAGTYQLTCRVTDGVGNTATSAVFEFSAHVTATAGSGPSSGGGGGAAGGAATTPTLKVDVDLSQPAAEEVTISKQQGRIVTFSLDGQNSHKMTFKEVTAARVTLVIESEPIEITLAVGETKQVDVDGDGTNDLEITLVGIKNGVADVKTKKIAETTLETTTTTTLEQVTTTTQPVVAPPAAEKASLAWLWILIVIVVIVVIVLVARKKKRR